MDLISLRSCIILLGANSLRYFKFQTMFFLLARDKRAEKMQAQ